MTSDEAHAEAVATAEQNDVQLGSCFFEYQHPRRFSWVLAFAMKEDRPEWCWLFSTSKGGEQPYTFVAMKKPKRFLQT